MHAVLGMTTPAERDELEQIREIVVGAIQRDLERKLTRVESHLSTRITELQQEARRRTDVIETHLRKETDALSARVEKDLVEIKEALRGLSRDHRETSGAVGQRVAKLEETVSHAQQELRSQILDQAKSFMDEMQRMR